MKVIKDYMTTNEKMKAFRKLSYAREFLLNLAGATGFICFLGAAYYFSG